MVAIICNCVSATTGEVLNGCCVLCRDGFSKSWIKLRHWFIPIGVDLSSTCHNVACPEVLKIWYCDEIQWDNYRSDFAS
jgi:hypothetical protein